MRWLSSTSRNSQVHSQIHYKIKNGTKGKLIKYSWKWWIHDYFSFQNITECNPSVVSCCESGEKRSDKDFLWINSKIFFYSFFPVTFYRIWMKVNFYVSQQILLNTARIKLDCRHRLLRLITLMLSAGFWLNAWDLRKNYRFGFLKKIWNLLILKFKVLARSHHKNFAFPF